MKTLLDTLEHDDDKNVFKRCGCVNPATGRRSGSLCPQLADPGHGTWYFAAELPTQRGRRQRLRRGGYATCAEARSARDQVLGQPSGLAAGKVWTLERWLRQWLVDISDVLRPTTVNGYAQHVCLYLAPHLGHIVLAELTTRQVQSMLRVLSGRQRADLGRDHPANSCHAPVRPRRSRARGTHHYQRRRCGTTATSQFESCRAVDRTTGAQLACRRHPAHRGRLGRPPCGRVLQAHPAGPHVRVVVEGAPEHEGGRVFLSHRRLVVAALVPFALACVAYQSRAATAIVEASGGERLLAEPARRRGIAGHSVRSPPPGR